MDPSTEEAGPKFPDVSVQLTGNDGNAFAILAAVKRGLKGSESATPEDVEAFMAEAMSGDYDHLLVTCMRWVDVR